MLSERIIFNLASKWETDQIAPIVLSANSNVIFNHRRDWRSVITEYFAIRGLWKVALFRETERERERAIAAMLDAGHVGLVVPRVPWARRGILEYYSDENARHIAATRADNRANDEYDEMQRRARNFRFLYRNVPHVARHGRFRLTMSINIDVIILSVIGIFICTLNMIKSAPDDTVAGFPERSSVESKLFLAVEDTPSRNIPVSNTALNVVKYDGHRYREIAASNRPRVREEIFDARRIGNSGFAFSSRDRSASEERKSLAR